VITVSVQTHTIFSGLPSCGLSLSLNGQVLSMLNIFDGCQSEMLEHPTLVIIAATRSATPPMDTGKFLCAFIILMSSAIEAGRLPMPALHARARISANFMGTWRPGLVER